MKKIIDRRTYDTDTAAFIADRWKTKNEGVGLYQTRHGAFFFFHQSPHRCGREIEPLTEEEAREFLEENANNLVKKYFGPFSEARAQERRLTVRIPGSLAHRLETAAQAKGVPLNQHTMRCLEGCVSKDKQTHKVLTEMTHGDQWFRYWMPYHFVRLSHAKLRHMFLPVNRNYKPLGITSRNHVKYEDYMPQAVAFSKDPATIEGVWWDSGGLFLYNDGAESRKNYFERLGKLLSRSARLVERTRENAESF